MQRSKEEADAGDAKPECEKIEDNYGGEAEKKLFYFCKDEKTID